MLLVEMVISHFYQDKQDLCAGSGRTDIEHVDKSICESKVVMEDVPVINVGETTAASEPSFSWANYKTSLLKNPVSSHLRKGYKKAPLRDKTLKWALMKTKLAELQKQGYDILLKKKLDSLDHQMLCVKKKSEVRLKCMLEEHNVRMLLMQKEHEARLEVLELEKALLTEKIKKHD
ncbi:uncharacterized protein LOC106668339 isoform X2 [Cimex lectularius]|uniref:Uncharacterized protein n=1 Tax=Cimex lectularius TaxID=79782 RepID=A0A8I6RU47_CIMLE|nr:uncharacterized protein LOC106668339 isoform X2 [Cimex lectularius]